MSLRLKYLLTLNAAVLIVWVGYAYWSFKESKRNYIKWEVNAIKHLGLGLQLSVQQMARSGRPISDIQAFLKDLSGQWGDLDIMIIKPGYEVAAATIAHRVGEIWHEPDIETVLSGKKEVIWKTKSHLHEGEPAFDSTVGVRGSDGRMVCAIHIAKKLKSVRAALSRHRQRDIIFALLLLVVVGFLTNFLTYKVVILPLKSLSRQIEESPIDLAEDGRESAGSSEGHDAAERPELRGDEVSMLQQVFHRMMERVRHTTHELQGTIREKDRLLVEVAGLKEGLVEEVKKVRKELMDTQAKLLRSERISAQQQLGMALAHEIRNPLHIVRGTAETVARRIPEAKPMADDIVEEVDRVEQLIKALLDYTRPITPQIEPLSVDALLTEVKERVKKGMACMECEEIRLRLDKEVEEGVVEGDHILLAQALINLVTNACEACKKGDGVELGAHSDGRGGYVFEVLDRGSGISEEDRHKVFEAFFTRKPQGTGLGLSMVQKVADLHGGSVELSPRPGGGTQAKLHVPAAQRRI